MVWNTNLPLLEYFCERKITRDGRSRRAASTTAATVCEFIQRVILLLDGSTLAWAGLRAVGKLAYG